MGLRHPHQRRAQRIGLAGVDGDADAAAADIDRAHVIEAAFAADHDRQPGVETRLRREGSFKDGAVAAVEQFQLAADRVGGAGGLGRARVSRIGVSQAAFGRPGPDRPGRRVGEAAQHLGLLNQRLMLQVHFSELSPQSGQFAQSHHGLAADGAAHRLDGVTV